MSAFTSNWQADRRVWNYYGCRRACHATRWFSHYNISRQYTHISKILTINYYRITRTRLHLSWHSWWIIDKLRLTRKMDYKCCENRERYLPLPNVMHGWCPTYPRRNKGIELFGIATLDFNEVCSRRTARVPALHRPTVPQTHIPTDPLTHRQTKLNFHLE